MLNDFQAFLFLLWLKLQHVRKRVGNGLKRIRVRGGTAALILEEEQLL